MLLWSSQASLAVLAAGPQAHRCFPVVWLWSPGNTSRRGHQGQEASPRQPEHEARSLLGPDDPSFANKGVVFQGAVVTHEWEGDKKEQSPIGQAGP